MRLAVHFFFLVWLLGCGAARAGIADFSDRPKIDFDEVIQLLNPYGTWSKIGGLWAFTPTNHQTPYTSGRWLYTEYGWYWEGSQPYGWATEHYGFWKRDANRIWSWFPGETWLPQIVEIRATSTHIGWRSAEVDENGAFVEAPDDRMEKVDEWTFVSREQFTRPITPAVIVSTETAAKLLGDSTSATHTYVTYRAITRAGPHPADFLVYTKSGGTIKDAINATGMFPPGVESSSLTPLISPQAVTPVAAQSSKPAAAAGVPAGLATDGTAASTNAAPEVADDNGAPADTRQVPYWVTMNLPTIGTKQPESAQPNEIFIYKPEIYQDLDGIQRRISLWINPKTRASLSDLRNVLVAPPKTGAATSSAASAAPGHNPFRSPFDESFHGESKSAPASTNAPSGKAPVPSGLADPSTHAPPSP